MTIRKMRADDREAVLEMMRTFYRSPAVLHKADEATLRRDVDACVSDCPYVEGYVFDADGEPAGYAMIAKSYSTEYGGACIWVEDLYIRPAYRGLSLSSAFFDALEREYAGKALRFRLEVERKNAHALEVYRRRGYTASPYMVMDKLV